MLAAELSSTPLRRKRPSGRKPIMEKVLGSKNWCASLTELRKVEMHTEVVGQKNGTKKGKILLNKMELVKEEKAL